MSLLRDDFQEEIESIVDQIKLHAENRVLNQYIDNPPISQLRVCLLYLFLRQCGIAESKLRKYIVTAMLIQLGLDSHERVSLSKEDTPTGIRTRQLTILAGDYFSGQYYHLLADMEDVQTIKQLARSIQEINEWKISLYWENGWTAEQYLRRKVDIESSLLCSFGNAYGADTADVWMRIFSQMLLIEQLLVEYRACRFEERPGRYFHLLSQEEGTHNAYQSMLQNVHKALHQCRKLTALVEGEECRTELKHLVEQCTEELDNQKARAEEM
ncbi:heptaprenyl diphosphate synthase component 1 [Aneurinibacillus migulanus]|uniref:heptaprenyl diphosphate synthase component 1 n=1 Tax=Aneurinibacillus migulanus TaxID=47500 RepID=UPI00209F85A0|nr:heptaprenyl diphosphate synthase component 1 [Aneurinibacillus migulanus]MCP1354174.1 heptaprenyl diphosphate synthase component 1 [Aneurinibacillus migulanus]